MEEEAAPTTNCVSSSYVTTVGAQAAVLPLGGSARSPRQDLHMAGCLSQAWLDPFRRMTPSCTAAMKALRMVFWGRGFRALENDSKAMMMMMMMMMMVLVLLLVAWLWLGQHAIANWCQSDHALPLLTEIPALRLLNSMRRTPGERRSSAHPHLSPTVSQRDANFRRGV